MKIPKLVLQVMNLVLQLVLQVILQVKPAKKKKATKLRKLGTTACKFPKFFQEKPKRRHILTREEYSSAGINRLPYYYEIFTSLLTSAINASNGSTSSSSC